MDNAERKSIIAELTPPYALYEPEEQLTPFVFCSPHSGRIYPKVLLESARLDAHALRKSEDCYVDEIFASVVGLGAPLLAARFPRAYLDVNREPYELDPELFFERIPDFANTQSVRVAGGLGTIPRVVADAEEIYRRKLNIEAGLERIDRLYRPFHAALGHILDRTRHQFGTAILIDCHSMPSASTVQPGIGRPHFVLGDRFGASCDVKLTRFIRDVLAGAGYEVQLNRPYAGGFITEHYGKPARGVHALQLEINRSLYLDEATLERTPGYDRLAQALADLCARLFSEMPILLEPRAAAE
jgi:N-formylglutamate amidohydrolase